MLGTGEPGHPRRSIHIGRSGTIGYVFRWDSSVTGTRRNESFDEAAEDYNRWRAGYPDEVVEDVVDCAHIDSSSRVLEVGCGTGQLSVPLADRGVDMVAVEVGSISRPSHGRTLPGFRRHESRSLPSRIGRYHLSPSMPRRLPTLSTGLILTPASPNRLALSGSMVT